MTFIIGFVIGALARHILWYKERREALLSLFRTKKKPYIDV